MGDYMQKKDLDEGFNLVYLARIFIGGNINYMDFTFYNGNGQKNLSLWLFCIFFLVHIKSFKAINMQERKTM